MIGIGERCVVEVAAYNHGVGGLLHVGFDFNGLVGSIAVRVNEA